MGKQQMVSIIIPCYNSELFVREAIESALAQTYRNIEVIVVDDGSTDGSLEVIKSFGKRIQWLTGPNRGACYARNKALEISKGEFIQFLDADDLIVQEKIEKQIPYLISNIADVVLCYGLIFGDGKSLRPKKRVFKSPDGLDPFVFACTQGFSTHGPLHKRDFLEKINGFNPIVKRGQETEMHLRLTCAGARLFLLKERLHVTRNSFDPNRITRSKLPENYFFTVLNDLAWELTNNPIYDFNKKRKEAFRKIYLHNARHLIFKGYCLDVLKRMPTILKLC
jgi:glycosyltransferase involved in cell wall biosynthesis